MGNKKSSATRPMELVMVARRKVRSRSADANATLERLIDFIHEYLSMTTTKTLDDLMGSLVPWFLKPPEVDWAQSAYREEIPKHRGSVLFLIHQHHIHAVAEHSIVYNEKEDCLDYIIARIRLNLGFIIEQELSRRYKQSQTCLHFLVPIVELFVRPEFLVMRRGMVR